MTTELDEAVLAAAIARVCHPDIMSGYGCADPDDLEILCAAARERDAAITRAEELNDECNRLSQDMLATRSKRHRVEEENDALRRELAQAKALLGKWMSPATDANAEVGLKSVTCGFLAGELDAADNNK